MATWKYVVKADFAQQYGDKVAGQFVALMMRVGSMVAPGNADEAQQQLQEGCATIGVQLEQPDVVLIAQNLTDPQNDIVVFCEESGTVIAEHRLRRAVIAA